MNRGSVFGGAELTGNMRRWGKAFNRRQRAAVVKAAERTLKMAVRNAPEDEGDLRESGRVVVSPKGMSATVTFGGPGIPQAIPVHEHLSDYSPPSWQKAVRVTFSPAGTGPQYLMRALMAGSKTLPAEFKRDLAFESYL